MSTGREPPPIVGAQGPGAHVTQNIYPGAAPAPRLAAPLTSLQEGLLSRHALFGGREAELQVLDRLVATSTRSYHFVTGPSGFGKTALLVNWIARLRTSRHAVALHFVSRLDGMAGEAAALRNLCEQLGAYHELPGELPVNLDALRALYVRLLQLEPREGETLVVVLDALDEALDWSPMRPLFPALAPRTHVVFSARAENEEHRRTRLASLGLAPDRVDVVNLDALAEAGVADLLRAAGGRAAERAADTAFVRAVRDASKGDPFYLRLLADDLVEKETSPAAPPAGLHAYLEEWKQQLLADVDINRDEVYALLGLLTAALGRLRPGDLAEISPALQQGALLNQELGGKLRRYLAGDRQSGYALCHPRFREYLFTDFFTKPELAEYRRQLLAYCARWREHGSDYALTHYPSHLAEAGQRAELYALVDEDWKDARLRQTSSLLAFAGDVELVIATAQKEKRPDLVQIARASLIYATLTTIAESLPPIALRALAAAGQSRLARDYAAQVKDAGGQAARYVAIAEGVADTDPAGASEILELARVAAEKIGAATDRADVLAGMAAAWHRIGDQAAVARTAAALEALGAELSDSGRLSTVAQWCARAGRAEAAAALARRAAEADVRAQKSSYNLFPSSYASVTALAAAGELDAAVAKAAAEPSISQRIRGLCAVASAAADRGARDQALAVATRALTEVEGADASAFGGFFESRKEDLLCVVATALAHAGDARAAEDTALEALALADIPEEPGFGFQPRSVRLARVAATLASLGKPDTAHRAAAAAARAMEEAWVGTSLPAVAAMLPVLSRAGASVDALAEKVRRVAEETAPGYRAVEMLAEVAMALGAAGQKSAAEVVLRRLARLVENVGREGEKISALAELAIAATDVGARDIAPALAETARSLLRADDGLGFQVKILGRVALARLRARRAADVADLKILSSSPEHDRDPRLLGPICRALAETGRGEEAKALTHEIAAGLGMVTDDTDRGRVLLDMAAAMARAGLPDWARNQALAVLPLTEHANGSVLMPGIAEVLIEVGPAEKAEELAAKVLDKTLTVQTTFIERELVRVVAALDALGDRGRARELSDAAVAAVELLGPGDWNLRAAFHAAALSAAALGDDAAVRRLAARAQRESPPVSATLDAAVASALLLLKQDAAARVHLDRAFDVMLQTRDSYWARTLLREVAPLLARIGNGGDLARLAEWSPTLRHRSDSDPYLSLVDAYAILRDGAAIERLVEDVASLPAYARTRVLAGASTAVLALGDRARAAVLARQALDAFMEVHDGAVTPDVLPDLVPALLGVEDRDGLLRLLRMPASKWPYPCEWVPGLRLLLPALVRLGLDDPAPKSSVALRRENEKVFSAAEGEIVEALARRGRLDDALARARTIPDGDSRAAALATIALVIGATGDGARADAVAREALAGSAGLSSRVAVLSRLAVGLGRAADLAAEPGRTGDLSAGPELRGDPDMTAALRRGLVRELPTGFVTVDVTALETILPVLVKLPDAAGLARARGAIAAAGASGPATAALVLALANAGRADDAAPLAAECERAAERIAGAQRAIVLATLARAHTRGERHEDGRRLLQDALQAARPAGRGTVFQVLGIAASAFQERADDGGLRRLHDAIQDVDAWWTGERRSPAS
jgi:hypothetical protein